MEERTSGNSCLFCLFVTANIALIVVGLATMITGIFICADSGSFTWYNGSFVLLGLITMLLAVLGYKAKFSMASMAIYLLGILIVFTLQLGFTIGIIAYGGFSDSITSLNANGVRYSLLGTCAIILLCAITAYFYRGSLKDANFYAEHKRSLTNQKLKAEKAKKAPKTQARREEMESKYADMKKKYYSNN